MAPVGEQVLRELAGEIILLVADPDVSLVGYLNLEVPADRPSWW